MSTPRRDEHLDLALTSQMLPHSIFFVLAYTVAALTVYAYASYILSCQIAPLEGRCIVLQNRLKRLIRCKTELSSITSSLLDPASDEYALITELGRIPSECSLILLETSAQNEKP